MEGFDHFAKQSIEEIVQEGFEELAIQGLEAIAKEDNSKLTNQAIAEFENQFFDDLVKQYEPMIYKIIRSLHIYKNKEEYFQLGLVGLWEAMKRFNPKKGDFTNYAYTYIKGLFLSEMTKVTRHEERCVYPKDEFWEAMEDIHPEQPLEKKLLLSYCRELTDNQTKWVLYTCLDGLSVKEIADYENVSVSAVKAWRKGAREKLRKTLNY